jgi:hypothetical protein
MASIEAGFLVVVVVAVFAVFVKNFLVPEKNQ